MLSWCQACWTSAPKLYPPKKRRSPSSAEPHFYTTPFIFLFILHQHIWAVMTKHITLFEPPPQDESRAQIENVLDLTPVVDLGPVTPLIPYASYPRIKGLTYRYHA